MAEQKNIFVSKELDVSGDFTLTDLGLEMNVSQGTDKDLDSLRQEESQGFFGKEFTGFKLDTPEFPTSDLEVKPLSKDTKSQDSLNFGTALLFAGTVFDAFNEIQQTQVQNFLLERAAHEERERSKEIVDRSNVNTKIIQDAETESFGEVLARAAKNGVSGTAVDRRLQAVSEEFSRQIQLQKREASYAAYMADYRALQLDAQKRFNKAALPARVTGSLLGGVAQGVELEVF
jgi:hypothetical protein